MPQRLYSFQHTRRQDAVVVQLLSPGGQALAPRHLRELRGMSSAKVFEREKCRISRWLSEMKLY